MVSNIFMYIQQMEMLVFFSAYPLVYFLVRTFASNISPENSKRRFRLISILPYAYALSGTLYFALTLKNNYGYFTLANSDYRIQHPYLVIWALMSILFWIPALAKRMVLSLLHSLVFFYFIIRDFFFQVTGYVTDHNILRNDMRIYTVSIFLNLTIYTVLAMFFFRFAFGRKNQQQ